MTKTTSKATRLKVATLNVNGLRSSSSCVSKRRKFFSWFKQLKVDIICLQETHSDECTESIWRNEWGGLGFFASGSERSRGVAILVKPGLPIRVNKEHKDPEGRFIIIEIDYLGVKATLGNVYGPNTDDPAVFEQLCAALGAYSNEITILAGDFNFCMDIKLDRITLTTRLRNHTKCREIVCGFAEENNLVDAWRAVNPYARKYTFDRTNPPSKSRIYFFLVSESLLNTASGLKAEITDGYLADHKMVQVELELSASPRGRSFWKLNNALLKEDGFVEMIQSSIPRILEINNRPECSRILLLETVLTVIRGEIISYASRRKKRLRANFENLEEKIS